MRYSESTFVRDGKVYFHFNYDNGISEETDVPAIAEGIRRRNRAEEDRLQAEAEARLAAAMDTSIKKQTQCMLKEEEDDPDTLRHTSVLNELQKNEYDRSDLKPSLDRLQAGISLPATVEKTESALATSKSADEPSTRVDLSKKIKTTSWRDLLETENYGIGLHFTQSGGEMTMLPNLFYTHGGCQIKDAYKDPARRQEVIDEIMAAQVASYIGISQMAGMMMASVRDQAISENFTNPNSPFKSALEIKTRADKMLLQVIESHHRVKNAVAGNVFFNKAEQINLQYNTSDQKGTKREETPEQPRLPGGKDV